MATISPTPKLQFFGNDGNLLAGGKLYTYLAGTNVPSATFVDYTETTYNTNPVILDSRGEANVWLGSSIKYKFALQDANGAPIYTVDNVNTTSSGGGGGGSSNVTGDFSNPVLASRNYAITTTANGNTSFGAIPNGTGNYAEFTAYNSSTPANSSFTRLTMNGTTEARLESGALGAGTQLPLNLYTNGTLRANFDTAGNINFIGSLTNTGPVTSTGPASVFRINRRDTSAYVWGIYSNTGALQFYNNATAADMITFGPAGQIGIGSPPNYGAAGASLVSGGSSAPPTWTTSSVAGPQLNFQLFTATGSWTCPAGVTKVRASVSAGGGGGTAYSAYGYSVGGAGGQGNGVFTVVPGTTYAVTIGLGGAGLQSAGTAASGGASSFASFITCTGGTGAYRNQQSATNGTNGTATGATLSGAACGVGPIGTFAITSSTTPFVFNASNGRAGGSGGSYYVYSTGGCCPTFTYYGNGGVGGFVALEWVG